MLPRSRSKSQGSVPPITRVSRARGSEPGDEPVLGFPEAFARMAPTTKWAVLSRRRGREPRVALTALVQALIFHTLHRFGTLGEHFALLFSDALSDSSCSDRRQRLPGRFSPI